MRSSTLPPNAAKSCGANNRSCNGICSGYGTRQDCPPLIVLAVLASSASSAEFV
jgi:hypothetical protein